MTLSSHTGRLEKGSYHKSPHRQIGGFQAAQAAQAAQAHLRLMSNNADRISSTMVAANAEKQRSKAREVFRKSPLTRFHSSQLAARLAKPGKLRNPGPRS